MMSMMRQVNVCKDKNHHYTGKMNRYFASYQLKCVDSMLCNNNRLLRLCRSNSSSLISCLTSNSCLSSSSSSSSSSSRYSTTSSISSCDSIDSNLVGEYSLDINDYLKDPHPKFNVPRGIVLLSSLLS